MHSSRSSTPINYGPEAQRSRMPLPATPSSSRQSSLMSTAEQSARRLAIRLQNGIASVATHVTSRSSSANVSSGRCEHCQRCLLDLKRQAFQLTLPNPKSRDLLLSEQPNLVASVVSKLRLPFRPPDNGHCSKCNTNIQQLKLEAVHCMQNTSAGTYAAQATRHQPQMLQRSNSTSSNQSSGKTVTFAPSISSSCNRVQTSLNRGLANFNSSGISSSVGASSQIGYYSPTHRSHTSTGGNYHSPTPQQHLVVGRCIQSSSGQDLCSSPLAYSNYGHRMSSTPPPGRKKRKHHHSELMRFNSKFAEVIRHNPPPIPPNLLSTPTRTTPCQSMSKVKVVVKVVSKESTTTNPSCLSVDPRRKQVTVFEQPHHRTGSTARVPKMFAFDTVFSDDHCQHELASTALVDIIHGVVNGTDGCVFVFGHSKLGKSQTMLGSDSNHTSLGVIPRAISWLFQCIQEQKDKSSARFSVRVSAVEISGKDENLKDLLSDVAKASDASAQTSPAVYLREDPISGTQIENQSELRAPSADKAAYYLDAALHARSQEPMSHLLVTLHVYQYRVERCDTGSGVAGGRSRLHLLDLGSGRSNKDQGSPALSLAALGSVLLALVNGQRHIPYRDSKLSQLLREALGSLACRACMICQISSSVTHQTDTVQMLQLASKIQKLRKRKAKFSSNSSDSSSCDSFGVRRAGRLRPQMGTLRESTVKLNALTSASETDYSSSSEQSCNTVIFMGKNGELTDNEHPPQSLLNKLAQVSSGDDSDTGTETGSTHSHSSRRNMPRTNAKVRPPQQNFSRLGKMNAVETLSTQKEHWIDGPNAQQVGASTKSKTSNESVAITKPSRIPQPTIKEEPTAESMVKERWIDGPNASPPSTEERRKSIEMANDIPVPGVQQIPKVKKETDICDPPRPVRKDAETQSEEPYESESSTSTYSTMDRKNQRVLSDISEKTEDISSKSGAELDDEIVDDLDDGRCHEVLDKMEIPSLPPSATTERPKKSKPIGSLQSSLPRVKASTLHDSTIPGSESKTGNAHHHKSSEHIKPFVRDWVEKHSVISSSESGCNEEAPDCSAHSSPVHTMKELPGHASTPTHTGHSKHSSRSRSVKCKKSMGDSQPVPVATNHDRVAQWLQEVNTDERRHSNAAEMKCKPSDHHHQRSTSQSSDIKMVKSVPVDYGTPSKSSTTKQQQLRDRSTSSHKRDKSEKKSRLSSFLTSPLFGKKSKDKVEKLPQPTTPTAKSNRKPRKSLPNSTLLSPYHTITQPRVSVHSSSGHGSDCSYNIYGINRRHGTDIRHCVTGGASSGYESMLRDSEASSCVDTGSERSVPAKNNNMSSSKVLKKRSSSSAVRKSSRSRSRSAPPGSQDGSISGEETETKVDDKVEIERQIYFEKISELLMEQDTLKEDLMTAKNMLMADRSTWGFDLHVAHSMDPEASGFLESLRKETEILRKRVHACKSHITMMTCFDSKTVQMQTKC